MDSPLEEVSKANNSLQEDLNRTAEKRKTLKRRVFLEKLSAVIGLATGILGKKTVDQIFDNPNTMAPTSQNINNQQIDFAASNTDGDRIISQVGNTPNFSTQKMVNARTEDPQENLLLQMPHRPDNKDKKLKDMEFDQKRQAVLNLKVFSPERGRAEDGLVKNAQTRDELLDVLEVIADQDVRADAMEKLYELRQKLPNNPLSQKHIEWAINQGIHPETLGLVLDYYQKLIMDVATFQSQPGQKNQLRADLANKQIDPKQLLPNPGLLVAIIIAESKYRRNILSKVFEKISGKRSDNQLDIGFANIGQGNAKEQINLKQFPNGAKDIDKIAKQLEDYYGLKYNPDNLPGSIAPSKNDSGGALGVGEMPDKVLYLSQLFQEVLAIPGYSPFKIEHIVRGTGIFLADEIPIKDQTGNITDHRVGYERGDMNRQVKALQKWFGKGIDVQKYIKTGESYAQSFPEE